LRDRRPKSGRDATRTISARLVEHITLKALSDGKLVASFNGHSVGLGTFSEDAADVAQRLRTGLPLASFAASRRKVDKEIDLLVRRLARHGLLEYRLRRPGSRGDQVVIEPQMADYWPRAPLLRDSDVVVLSRFAYLRRRGADMILESPLAGAIFKICDPQIAAGLTTLVTPQKVQSLRKRKSLPHGELLALLIDCRMLFKVGARGDKGLRPSEGDDPLVLWDFHDLLFHTRSTEGRHANPLGGLMPYAGAISPLPAQRPPWPGEKIDLRALSASQPLPKSTFATLLSERRSTRDFDASRPITLPELARFLDATARILSTSTAPIDPDYHEPEIEYTHRPYPSAGASYELELYLAVDQCDGLARGFYYYDAGDHALAPIAAPADDLARLLTGGQFAMGAAATPQILITVAARFGRVAWKYSAIAYSLILKDVGVLLQTFYLMAADMGLGGCAIGLANIELFAKMTGVDFHIEGPVGQFALGRAASGEAAV
jgi:SagB-type dehydrogenase family enzyme